MKKKLHTKKLSKKVEKKLVRKKFPLRGKPITDNRPSKPVDLDEGQDSPRVPGIDKGKVIVMPNFDDPLEEFEE